MIKNDVDDRDNIATESLDTAPTEVPLSNKVESDLVGKGDKGDWDTTGRLGATEVVSVDSIVRGLIELGDRILAP